MKGNRVRWFGLIVSLALALGMICGCGGTGVVGSSASADAAAQESTGAVTATVYPVTVTDDAGREVTITERPERVVSLTPGNTEIICELGAIDRLVGVTAQCDYPAAVQEIDEVGDFAGPNLEAVAAADPDVVFVTTGIQAEVIEQLEELGALVVAIDPQTIEGLYASITTVGTVLDESAAAEEIVASMQADLEDISARIGGERVTCFLEIAQNPLYTVGSGTLLDELIVYAGGENVVTEAGYVAYSVEQLIAADPEVYLATAGSMSDPSDIDGRPGYEDLSAVTAGRVYVLDDNLVSRPGPRVIEGIRSIAEALYPDEFAG